MTTSGSNLIKSMSVPRRGHLIMGHRMLWRTFCILGMAQMASATCYAFALQAGPGWDSIKGFQELTPAQKREQYEAHIKQGITEWCVQFQVSCSRKIWTLPACQSVLCPLSPTTVMDDIFKYHIDALQTKVHKSNPVPTGEEFVVLIQPTANFDNRCILILKEWFRLQHVQVSNPSVFRCSGQNKFTELWSVTRCWLPNSPNQTEKKRVTVVEYTEIFRLSHVFAEGLGFRSNIGMQSPTLATRLERKNTEQATRLDRKNTEQIWDAAEIAVKAATRPEIEKANSNELLRFRHGMTQFEEQLTQD